MDSEWIKYEESFLPADQTGWNHPVFKKVKSLLDEETHFSETSVQVENGEPCKKCKSSLTYTYQKQVRSADEGFTSFTVCFECEYQLVE